MADPNLNCSDLLSDALLFILHKPWHKWVEKGIMGLKRQQAMMRELMLESIALIDDDDDGDGDDDVLIVLRCYIAWISW